MMREGQTGRSWRRACGGLSPLEGVLLFVAVAIACAVVYRHTRSAPEAQPSPEQIAARAESQSTDAPGPNISTPRVPPMPPFRDGSSPDLVTSRGGSTMESDQTADAALDLPPVPGRLAASRPAGAQDEDFVLEEILDLDLLKEVMGDEPVTTLDMFRDMLHAVDVPIGEKTALIEQFDEEDIHEGLDLLGEMDWGPEAESLFGALMSRWGALDPAGALDYAAGLESRRVRDAAVSSVLKKWAKTDPQAAMAWFSGLPKSDARVLSTSLRTLFKGVVGEDTAWVLDQVWSLPTKSMKSQALRIALNEKTLQGVDPEQLIRLHQLMPEGADKTIMARAIVDSWTRYNPEAAAAWIDNLTDADSRRGVVDRLVSTWGNDDPVRAAEWVAALPDEQLRKVQMGRITQIWVRSNPASASAWLSGFPPSPELDPAIQSFARGVMHQDPAAAWDWAETVTGTGARNRLLQQVGRAWIKQDPASAEGRIAASVLPQNIKNKLMGGR